MDYLPGPFTALIVIAAIVLTSAIKIASEHERFAVFRLGRFLGFKGPGVCYKVPGAAERWVRIKPGDVGEMMDTNLANIQSVDVPVRVDGKASIGQPVRVTRFDGDQLVVTLDPYQDRTVVCQKCGHINQL